VPDQPLPVSHKKLRFCAPWVVEALYNRRSPIAQISTALWPPPERPDNERVARQDFFHRFIESALQIFNSWEGNVATTVKNPVRLVNSFNLFCLHRNCVITESTHIIIFSLAKLLTSRSAKIFVLLISLAAIKKSYLFKRLVPR
jgi:hypothetical protein